MTEHSSLLEHNISFDAAATVGATLYTGRERKQKVHLGFLADTQKLFPDVLRGVASVLVEEVVVLDAPLCEAPPIVALLVEPNHASHPEPAEDWHVVLRQQRLLAWLDLSAPSKGRG